MSKVLYEAINKPVESRVEFIVNALNGKSISFIECRDSDRGSAAITALDAESFVSACKALNPPAIFIFKEYSLIDEQITWAISEISSDPLEQEKLKTEFLLKESEIFTQAMQICPEYFRCQCYFFSGPALVMTGCEAIPYSSIINALDSFEEYVKALRKSEKDKLFVDLQKKLNGIAEQVAEDDGFVAIRGRRKRAMYVLKHYRSEIPESRNLERPDQGSDLMDKNVVEVSRRAADIIEFGLSASPFYDDE